MKITAETALAAWAVGTAWLLIYVVTHHAHHQLGLDLDLTRVIRIASAVLGLAIFPSLRRWFAGWLAKRR